LKVWQKLVPVTSTRASLALLILRFVVGASFIMHGIPKLAHPMSWDGEHGPLPGVPGWLQLIIVLAETLGGWCLIFGFLTPLVAFIQVCDMLVVTFIVQMIGRGFPFVGPGGRSFEVEAHLLAGALVILLCGPGIYSIDVALTRLISWRKSTAALGV
jgi:putative oxidoreductase